MGKRGAWEVGECVVSSGFSEAQLLPWGLQFASQLVLTAAPAVLGGTECRSYCLARLTQHCWLSPRSPMSNSSTPLCTDDIGNTVIHKDTGHNGFQQVKFCCQQQQQEAWCHQKKEKTEKEKRKKKKK